MHSFDERLCHSVYSASAVNRTYMAKITAMVRIPGYESSMLVTLVGYSHSLTPIIN